MDDNGLIPSDVGGSDLFSTAGNGGILDDIKNYEIGDEYDDYSFPSLKGLLIL